jgi:tRNA(His) guanylyltransferase
MTDATALGDRMKRYEESSRLLLTPRMPLVIRVDGRAFHTYAPKVVLQEKPSDPWSIVLRDAMSAAARALVSDITGAKFAYIQSDEISVVVTDYESNTTEPWFGKSVQKVCSVAASIATMTFNASIGRSNEARGLTIPQTALFDARAFCVPEGDVTNYFVWRQRDAEKNSVSMLARHYFSHKQLHGKNGSEKQDMLMLEKGVNWNDLDPWKKRGWGALRTTAIMRLGDYLTLSGKTLPPKAEGRVNLDERVVRSMVVNLPEIPVFSQDRDFIEGFVRNVDRSLKGKDQ